MPESSKRQLFYFGVQPEPCPFHKDSRHKIDKCPVFRVMTDVHHLDEPHDMGLCVNCLFSDHHPMPSPSSKTCLTCNWTHHTLLQKDQQLLERSELVNKSSHHVTPQRLLRTVELKARGRYKNRSISEHVPILSQR